MLSMLSMLNMRISMIVACTENQVIGREGELPWKLKDDMRFFVKATLGKKVLMGRKTFESILKAIGKPLPGRENYVLTRDKSFQYSGVKIFHEISEVLKEIYPEKNKPEKNKPEKNKLENIPELMIAGGAEIYHQFLPLANKIYLTKIKINLEGDAFFPLLSEDLWEKVSSQSYQKSSDNQYDFEIIEFNKKLKIKN